MIRDAMRIGMLVVIMGSNPASSQQLPAWRKPITQSVNESQLYIRVALKPTTQCAKYVVELADVAELSGSDSILQLIRNLPLGPAPVRDRKSVV